MGSSSSLFFLALLALHRALAEDDFLCLQEFKKSVQDPLSNLQSWNFGNTTAGYVCSFYGVSCWNGGENKVMGIKLSGAGLTGNFPSGLAQCKALQSLDLSENSFTGSIPDDLCNQVPYITDVDLSQNSFSGNIPATFGNCQYLQDLALDHNKLSGEIPGVIATLSKLTSLDVSSNLLSGQIPTSFLSKPSLFQASSFSDNPGLCGQPVSNSCSSKPKTGLIAAVIVAVIAGIAILSAVCAWIYCSHGRKRKHTLVKDEHQWAKRIRAPKSVIVTLFETPLVKLKFSDLMVATNNFSKDSIIREGWMGTVYKAVLRDGSTLAVKRLRQSSRSEKEFIAEMKTLGRVRHRNLVPLLGYCSVASEKLLIYKHMVNGSLSDCLRDAHDETKLDWIARLKVAIGAARGLAWLHHSCNPRIVHRNISSKSIFLDEEYDPRVTDFGLARLMKTDDTHISTFVNGDFGELGFIAPEYSRTLVASLKGDVFSFGVVLLELVTGQKANDVSADEEFKGNLSEWVLFLATHGRIEEALDISLKGAGHDNELNQFLRVGCACVVRNPKERPTMNEVYQLLKAIGEKFQITDDELIVFVDVGNPNERDQLIVANGD